MSKRGRDFCLRGQRTLTRVERVDCLCGVQPGVTTSRFAAASLVQEAGALPPVCLQFFNHAIRPCFPPTWRLFSTHLPMASIQCSLMQIQPFFFFFNTFSAHHLSDLQLFFSSSKIAFSALRGNRYTKRRSIAASLDRNLIQRFQEGGGGAGVEGR